MVLTMAKNKMSDKKIAIIGGGIAGASIALYLSEIGLRVNLFEKGTSLVNGPPICHLHAGGNLYREIPDSECLTLLKESIESLRLYPDSVDYRPTVIAVPQQDAGEPLALLPRLQLLQREYQALIDVDVNNTHVISTDSVTTGRCIIKVDWTAKDGAYYHETELRLK